MDVESILKKTDTSRTARSFEDRLHQPAPDAISLRGWIDYDWANCSDRVTFAEKIEPDDAAIDCFGHYPENRGVSDEGLDALRCDLHGREGWSKTVALGDGPKTFIADATTCVSVVIRCRSDDDVHWSYCLTERKAA